MNLQRFLSCIALLCCALAARGGDFILSYWCGPPPGKDVDERYAEVATCNFNYAMPLCSGTSLAQNKAILDACKKYALKYIVMDGRINPSSVGTAAFKTNLEAVVADYSKHPALGGYFIADEPGPSAFPALAAINQYLLAKDPKRLPFINLFPNYAPVWALGGTYEQYVDNFVTTVKPKLLSYDNYALMKNGTERSDYFDNLEVIRRQALKHGIPFASIFLITPHGAYRNPDEAALRWQANTALAYGAKALLYFTYWPAPSDPNGITNAIIDMSGKQTVHYEQAQRVNAGIKAWSKTLTQLQSTDVFHTGSTPAGCRALPKDARVRVSGDEVLVLGMFKHHDGSEWLMVVNRDPRHAIAPTLQFDTKSKKLKELSLANGKLSSVKLRDHQLRVELLAGGARLFRLYNR